ncbi:hypothetical protein AALB51_15250 [Lachnospiraceae bacterium 62-26]
MNFFTVQSIGAYTRNMEMQLKWQQKKESSDFTADGSTKLDSVARQAEEIRLSQADGSAKLASQIRSKLANGQKLTLEEMEYLEKHDPQTYQKVKAIEAEKKNYEKELKKCKTKEEVQRARMNHTAASLSAVNNIKNNPAIPEEKKLELIWQEHMKNMALEEITKEFVESGRYAKLPTEAEKAEAEKEIKEAKEAELGIEDPAEDIEDEDPSQDEIDTEHVKEEVLSDPAGHAKEEVLSDPAGHAKESLAADKAKAVAIHEAQLKSREVLNGHRKTRMEAETTPEALKVKRARAQAAYNENRDDTVSRQLYDVKVK